MAILFCILITILVLIAILYLFANTILNCIASTNILIIIAETVNPVAVKFNTLVEILDVFGFTFPCNKLSADDRAVYNLWQEARNNKDFAKADEYRQVLIERGIL